MARRLTPSQDNNLAFLRAGNRTEVPGGHDRARSRLTVLVDQVGRDGDDVIYHRTVRDRSGQRTELYRIRPDGETLKV